MLALSLGSHDAIAQTRPEPGAETAEVAPVEEWVEFDRVEWRGDPIEVHLRTGYARPLIMPEPVRIVDRPPLPGCDIEVDREIVLFEPRAHFTVEELVLAGMRTQTRYVVQVRSSAYGERVPLELRLP